MKENIRKRIQLESFADAQNFVKFINDYNSSDEFVLQDKTGGRIADARTIMGVAYAVSEFNKNIYLVNKTNEGRFPEGIDQFRL